MRKQGWLLSLLPFLILAACSRRGLPADPVLSDRPAETGGATPETEEVSYGFSADRFGAVGSPYESEAVSMGTYPFPEEWRSWTDDDVAAQRLAAKQLINRIRTARADGTAQLIIEPGYYRFGRVGASSLDLNGLTDFELIGGPGVHFLQEAEDHVIRLIGCRNVTIRGVTVDYTNLYFVQATVRSFDTAGNPVVSLDDGYQESFQRLGDRLTGNRIIYFDGNDLTREKVNTIHRGFLQRFSDNGDGTYTVFYNGENVIATQKPSVNVTAGDKMVVFSRSGPHAVRLANCESITLEDVDIYGSGGFGIAEEADNPDDENVGNNVFRRVRLIRRPGTDRLVAISADGFHSTNVRHGALLEKCEISYTEDDALNYHTFLGFVTAIRSNTEIEVTFPLTTLLDINTPLTVFEKGTATITAITRVTDPDAINEAKKTDAKILAARGETVRDFPSPVIYQVTLDTPITGVSLYDWVGSTGYSGAGLSIRDCYFHDVHGRAITVTGPETRITGCMFRRIPGVTIDLQRGGLWAEGPYPTGITIDNNVFEENGFALEAQIKPGVIVASCPMVDLIHDIVVRSNTFRDNCVGAFYAYHVTSVVFAGNVVSGYVKTLPTESGKGYMQQEKIVNGFYGLTISHCTDAEVRDNTFSDKGKYARGESYIVDTVERVTG